MVYNIVVYLYGLAIFVVSLFNDKVRRMRRGQKESFSILNTKVVRGEKYLWFHAASLGEFEQGRPLIERIKRNFPDKKILLTFFSPSGYEVRKYYEYADIVCYLPLDTKVNVNRFLSFIDIEKAYFIKYEFWYNYARALNKRGVPLYSVSSIFRANQIFFKWYGRGYRKVLFQFTHFYVQTEESCRLLFTLGLRNVSITGDTRFDRVLEIRDKCKEVPIVESFAKDKKVFVVGSSWEADEAVYLPYFKLRDDWKLIIAPHVTDECNISRLISSLGDKKVVRYSKISVEEAGNADVLIIDCFGLLSSIYRYGEVSYVGGGFGVGIHNVLEAAVWRIPVLFGPNNKKFAEAQELIQSGGAFEINNQEEFTFIFDRLSTNEEELFLVSNIAYDYVKSKAGASQKILEHFV